MLIRKSVNLPGSTKSTVTTAGAEGAEAADGETTRSLVLVQPKLPMITAIAQIAQNVGFIAIEPFKIQIAFFSWLVSQLATSARCEQPSTEAVLQRAPEIW